MMIFMASHSFPWRASNSALRGWRASLTAFIRGFKR